MSSDHQSGLRIHSLSRAPAKRSEHDWAVVAAGLHTAAVVLMCVAVAASWGEAEKTPVYWVLFLVIDFPLGWMTLLVLYGVDDLIQSTFVQYTLVAAASFAVFGGVQWYMIVRLVFWACAHRDEVPECRHCGYDLRGSLEVGRCPECGTPFDPSLVTTVTQTEGTEADSGGPIAPHA